MGAIATVLFLLALAVGAWGYDNAQKDQIAPGVTVGGVEVGGRSADEASRLIRNEVVAPLTRPIKVLYGKRTFTLTAKQLKQRADVDGMVDAAVEASREGHILERVWRYGNGGSVDANIAPQVTYSSKAVDDFVDRIALEVNREPQDASIIPSGDRLEPTPSRVGVEVRQERLTRLITEEVESPLGERKVEVAVRKTQPDITRGELAEAYPTYITIDRANFVLRLFKKLKLFKKYTIAVGAIGYDTPSGLYTVQDMQVDPTWHVPESDWAGDLAGMDIPPGPSNPLKARWIGIYDGAGIHGTDDIGSLGNAASHGCVRMSIPDVIDLYDRVDIGTPIYVQ